jgi:hypothetical protein
VSATPEDAPPPAHKPWFVRRALDIDAALALKLINRAEADKARADLADEVREGMGLG